MGDGPPSPFAGVSFLQATFDRSSFPPEPSPYARRGVGPLVRVSTGALLAAGSALAYGSLAVLAKLAYAEGWNVPSLLVARFLSASLVLLPFALAAGGSWRGFGGGLVVGAVGFAGTTALYFPALQHLPAAVASFLLYLAPVFVALLSWAFLRERLTRRVVAALVLALAGLVLMASGAATGALSAFGVLLALGSALTYSFTVLGGRHLTRGIVWSRAALGTCFGALLSYLAFTALTGTLHVPASTPGLAYALGIGVLATGVPLSLFYAALPRIGASRTSLVLTLEPVSTLVLAAMFLAEIPAWSGVAGGLLIVGAAAMVASAAPPEASTAG